MADLTEVRGQNDTVRLRFIMKKFKFKQGYEFLIQSLGGILQVDFLKHLLRPNEYELGDVSLAPLPFAESRQDTTSFETGVGVYRGEVVTIQELGLSEQSHRWVIAPLLRLEIQQIDRETEQYLLCLAHHLAYYRQFSLPMTDSQKLEVIKLDRCPLMSQQESSLSHASVERGDNDATPKPLDKQLEESLICQLCQRLFPKAKLP